MQRFFIAATLLAGWIGSPCHADLYTGNELSLAWLVDSCDEVFIAEVTSAPERGVTPTFQRLETLKAPDGGDLLGGDQAMIPGEDMTTTGA